MFPNISKLKANRQWNLVSSKNITGYNYDYSIIMIIPSLWLFHHYENSMTSEWNTGQKSLKTMSKLGFHCFYWLTHLREIHKIGLSISIQPSICLTIVSMHLWYPNAVCEVESSWPAAVSLSSFPNVVCKVESSWPAGVCLSIFQRCVRNGEWLTYRGLIVKFLQRCVRSGE